MEFEVIGFEVSCVGASEDDGESPAPLPSPGDSAGDSVVLADDPAADIGEEEGGRFAVAAAAVALVGMYESGAGSTAGDFVGGSVARSPP